MDLKQHDVESLARFPDENPNPVMRISRSGILIYANPPSATLKRHWGIAVDERVPDDIFELVQACVQDEHARELDVLAGGATYALTFAPVEGTDYLNIYGKDVTAARAREAEIRDLAKFPDENPYPILRSSAEGILLYANRPSQRLLGLWGIEVGSPIPGELAERIPAAYAAMELEVIELVVEQRIFSITLAPVEGRGYVNLYGQDITEKKEADALARARDRALDASRAKSAFLANMSHELRTPMNAIIGYSEMLLEDAEDLGQEDFIPDLNRIRTAGKHLLNLINEILDLSKIEAGRMTLYLEDVEARPIFDEILSTVEPLVKQRGNQLVLECPDDLPVLHTDATKLRQCLLNLLGNASKFTENGTVTLECRVEHDTGKDWLLCAIHDTGIGMTPEQLERIWSAFTQADGSTTRQFGGTGLGLTITQKFSEMMGGKVTVESEHGTGSTFTLRVPVVVEEEETSEDEDATENTPASPTANIEDLSERLGVHAGDTVLLIDDDATVRDIIESTLKKSEIPVVSVPDGETGLRLARELKPAVIVLDILMPGVDGWTVLSTLKNDPVTAHIPVILATISDDKNMGFAMGASEYLTKPIDRDRLLSLLRKYQGGGAAGTILVVDDDETIRGLMRRYLAKTGWTVVEAVNGRDGLEKVREQAPSVVLLDLMMPEMDGFGFLEAFRAEPAWEDIPVVVVTAKDLSETDREKLSGTVERVLQKGAFSKDALVREISVQVKACLAECAENGG